MTTTRGQRRPPRSRQPHPSRTGGPRARSHPATPRAKAAQLKAAQQRRARRRAAALWLAVAAVLGGLIATAVLTTGVGSGTTQTTAARPAPGFTLTDTTGKQVSLASYRGHNVVLYFNEGAGCDACFYQMREFEQHAADLTKAGITILPIVMNPASQIRPELTAFGLHTPYLIDTTGSVSRAYGVLGKGMHGGLPGHGFVLIDASGIQRWYGEYPSMYLPTAGLLKQVRAHLGA